MPICKECVASGQCINCGIGFLRWSKTTFSSEALPAVKKSHLLENLFGRVRCHHRALHGFDYRGRAPDAAPVNAVGRKPEETVGEPRWTSGPSLHNWLRSGWQAFLAREEPADPGQWETRELFRQFPEDRLRPYQQKTVPGILRE